MAGAAGLEPVTSAVTGQRSNQLSYAPALGNGTLKKNWTRVKFCLEIFALKIRAADAKEVGVGNPAEETCCYPNKSDCYILVSSCQHSNGGFAFFKFFSLYFSSLRATFLG
jgi:hypothetical protein